MYMWWVWTQLAFIIIIVFGTKNGVWIYTISMNKFIYHLVKKTLVYGLLWDPQYLISTHAWAYWTLRSMESIGYLSQERERVSEWGDWLRNVGIYHTCMTWFWNMIIMDALMCFYILVWRIKYRAMSVGDVRENTFLWKTM